jgi:hypothetical protein
MLLYVYYTFRPAFLLLLEDVLNMSSYSSSYNTIAAGRIEQFAYYHVPNLHTRLIKRSWGWTGEVRNIVQLTDVVNKLNHKRTLCILLDYIYKLCRVSSSVRASVSFRDFYENISVITCIISTLSTIFFCRNITISLSTRCVHFSRLPFEENVIMFMNINVYRSS